MGLGINFDAKVRRGSFEPEDLFYAHIPEMDAYAKGLKIAAKMVEDGVLETGIGLDIVSGKASLRTMEAHSLKNEPLKNESGRLEWLTN